MLDAIDHLTTSYKDIFTKITSHLPDADRLNLTICNREAQRKTSEDKFFFRQKIITLCHLNPKLLKDLDALPDSVQVNYKALFAQLMKMHNLKQKLPTEPWQLLALTGSKTITRIALETYPDLAQRKDNDNRNYLHFAAISGNKTLIFYLLREFPELSEADIEGRNLLHYAIASNHLHLIQSLVKLFKGLIECDEQGANLLHHACLSGDEVIYDFLKECTEFENVKDSLNHHYLHYAIRGGNLSLIKKLLDQTNSYDVDIYELFLYACEFGQLDCIKYLREYFSVTFATDEVYRLALATGASGHIKVVEYLVKVCPELLKARHPYTGEHILLSACKAGNVKVTKYLLSAAKGKGVWRGADFYGNNLLHYACKGGALEIVKWISENFSLLQYNKAGMHFLYDACRSGSLELVEYLLPFYPNIKPDPNGLTLLHMACESGNIDLVAFIGQKMPKLNVPDKGGNWPAHFAVLSGNVKLLEYLKVQGFNLTVINDEKESLLFNACKKNRLACVKYLVEDIEINPILENLYNAKPIELSPTDSKIRHYLNKVSEIKCKLMHQQHKVQSVESRACIKDKDRIAIKIAKLFETYALSPLFSFHLHLHHHGRLASFLAKGLRSNPNASYQSCKSYIENTVKEYKQSWLIKEFGTFAGILKKVEKMPNLSGEFDSSPRLPLSAQPTFI